jgi:hypothetical protein
MSDDAGLRAAVAALRPRPNLQGSPVNAYMTAVEDALRIIDAALASSPASADAERLRAALDEVYDRAPGPWLASLTPETQATLSETGHMRRTLGRGRVTNPRLDQRLKANRRAATRPAEDAG